MHSRVWTYATRAGVFTIRKHHTRWIAELDGADFHTAATAAQLAYEVANGEGPWSDAGDPDGLGIPEDIDDWTAAG